MDETVFMSGGQDQEEALPPGLHILLTFLSGPDRGVERSLWKRRVVLGRVQTDLVINDSAASKRHAELFLEGGELFLKDLGSTNGTIVNGQRISETRLTNLDQIKIGETVIQVSMLEDVDSQSLEEVVVAAVDDDDTRPQPARRQTDPVDGPLPDDYLIVLEVTEGPDLGMKHQIKKRATLIGRKNADLSLADHDVSRRHASIEFVANDKAILKDLRSTNGTYLNRQRITVASIRNGDQIRVGATVLKFHAAKKPAGG